MAAPPTYGAVPMAGARSRSWWPLSLLAGGLAVVLLLCGWPHYTRDALLLLPAGIKFNYDEHKRSGDGVRVRWAGESSKPETIMGHRLDYRTEAGFTVSYGAILASCGDFYGNPYRPISASDTPEEEFKNMFKQIDGDPSDPNRFATYSFAGDVMSTFKTGWTRHTPNYLLLARENFDHFAKIHADTALHSKPHWKVRATKFLGTRRNEGPNKGGAWEAYSAGHRVAIKYAAQNKGDRDGLSRALAMNACASHFLSDLFAPGHLRTPRWFIDGLMAKAMHDEDNRYGLHVSNAKGDNWKMFGDGCRAQPENAMNRMHELAAQTQSAQEVVNSWLAGAPVDSSEVAMLIPCVKCVQEKPDKRDGTPLFKMHEQQMKQISSTGRTEYVVRKRDEDEETMKRLARPTCTHSTRKTMGMASGNDLLFPKMRCIEFGALFCHSKSETILKDLVRPRITFGWRETATARFSTGLIELPEKHYVDGDRVELNKKVCFHSTAQVKLIEVDQFSPNGWLGDCNIWADDTDFKGPCTFDLHGAHYELSFEDIPPPARGAPAYGEEYVPRDQLLKDHDRKQRAEFAKESSDFMDRRGTLYSALEAAASIQSDTVAAMGKIKRLQRWATTPRRVDDASPAATA